jgi:hypothetical protein
MVAFKTQFALKSLMRGTAALVLAGMATAASAITYSGVRIVGVGPLGSSAHVINLNITTDGTLGVLTAANFVNWTVAVDGIDPRDDFTYTPGNSVINLRGIALTATPTALKYNFDEVTDTYFQFAEFPLGASGVRHYWCTQTNAACTGLGIAPDGEAAYWVNGFAATVEESRSGLVTLATANTTGGVPEPAAWALLIGGFGLVGAVARRQRAVAC